MREFIICADLGGTKTRGALFELGTKVPNKKCIFLTPRHETGSLVLENLSSVIKEVWPITGNVKAIVIGAPGPLDVNRGVVIDAPLFQDLHDAPVLDFVEKKFKIPTFVQNDANLAALGEFAYGAGIGSKVLIYMTISTGVGGGIVINDELFLGSEGFGGELGHICAYPDGFLCGCGHHGCLEAHASGSALESEAYRIVHQGIATSLLQSFTEKGVIRVEDIASAALQGDDVSKELINKAAKTIGIVLSSLVNIFNPDCIVLGGGVSNVGPMLIDVIKQEIANRAMYPMCQQVKVVGWKLGDDAGLYGAYYYAKKVIDRW